MVVMGSSLLALSNYKGCKSTNLGRDKGIYDILNKIGGMVLNRRFLVSFTSLHRFAL